MHGIIVSVCCHVDLHTQNNTGIEPVINKMTHSLSHFFFCSQAIKLYDSFSQIEIYILTLIKTRNYTF